MKKLLLLHLALLFQLVLLPCYSHAQSCRFDQRHQQALSQDPTYAAKVQQMNSQINAMMQSNSNALLVNGANGLVYEIPVVVHVIHTGGAVGTAYNPSDAQLTGMIDYLNQTYAATWSGYPNASSGGTYIPLQFVLAKRTPTCTATTGIVRVDGSGLTNYTSGGIDIGSGLGANEIATKNLSRWPNDRYYNIWVVNKIDGQNGTSGGPYVAGFAYFPGASASLDGTVVLSSMAIAGASTVPHELAHAFGIYHTFEGDNSGTSCPSNTSCTGNGDMVCDTDPHIRSPYNCPTGTNPCTGNAYGTLVNNFMDYSNCRNRFTPGQRDRMISTLIASRSGLISSLGSTALPTTAMPTVCIPTIINANGNAGPRDIIITNTSGTYLDVTSSGFTTDGALVYIDNTCKHQVNLTEGTTYAFSVQTGPNTENVKVFIDYNNDGTFQSTEMALSSSGTLSNQVHSFQYTVPTTGIVYGTPLRMRVMSDRTIAPAIAACGPLSYGQAEDYSLVISAQACTGTPLIPTTGGPSSVCPGASFALTSAGFSTGGSIAYQWEYFNTTNNNWVAVTGATTSSYTVSSGITSTTQYRLKSTCTSTGLFSISNTTTVGISSYINCYCTPGTTSPAQSNHIMNVTFAGINNTTGAGNANGYNNYTTTATAASVMQGGAYPASLTVANGSTQYGGIWIDWDHSGTFDASEFKNMGSGANPTVLAQTIAVPMTAIIGQTYMRVRARSVTAFTATEACAGYSSGETEDYMVNVTPYVPCPGTPVLTSSSVTVCNNQLPYTWNGNNYSQAGTYSDTLTTVTNCDSIIILNLSVDTCYCTSDLYVMGCSNGDYINYFTTTGGTTNITNPSTGCSGGSSGYGYFPSMVHTATQGSTVNFSFTITQDWSQGVKMWVDWNKNGSFNDAGDEVYASGTPLSIGSTVNGSFAVPLNTLIDTLRLRIRCVYVTTTFTACSYQSLGEVEDYNLVIEPACSGAPSTAPITGPAAVCANTSFSLTSGNVTAPGIQYQWQSAPSGSGTWTPVPGAVNVSYSPTGITSATDYRLVKTCIQSAQSTASNIQSVVVNTLPSNVILEDSVTVCGTSTTVSATAGNYTYLWTGGATTQSLNITNSGWYACTLTNGSCSIKDSVYVGLYTISVSAGNDISVCAGQSVTLSATSNGTITWNNGVTNGQSFIPTATTTYTATATNSNGCTGSDDVTVNVTTLPSNVILEDSVSICGTSTTVSATAGNYTYLWTGGATTQSLNITNSGWYACTLTNGSCSIKDSVYVGLYTISVSAGNDISVCAGQSVTLSATSNGNITWNNGVTNGQSFIPTATTTYTATATNGYGCTSSDDVTVTVLSLPNVNAGADVQVCAGSSVTLTGSGAVTYQWSGGVTNGVSFIPSVYGSYLVTGTDANGCTNTDAVSVTMAPQPIASGGPDKAICTGGSTVLTASGGNSFAWNTGQTTQSLLVTQAGDYYVVVTNNFGCSDTSDIVNVQVKTVPTITITGNPLTVCHGDAVQLAISAGLNVSGFNMYWSKDGNIIPGATSTSYAADVTGNYTLTVSGGAICTKTSSAKTVTIKPAPSASFTAGGPTTFCEGGAVALTAPTVAGVTYTWLKNGNVNAGSGTTKNFNATGSYAVIATLNGCKDTSAPVAITVNPAPPLPKILSAMPTSVCDGNTVQLSLDPSVSAGSATLQWNLAGATIAGATNTIHQANATGAHTLTLTTVNGCTKTSSAKTVTIKPNPTASFTANGPTQFCAGGQVTLAAPSLLGYTYTWLKDGAVNAGTGNNKVIKAAGVYTVVATLNGCKDTSDNSETVTVFALPVATVTTADPKTICAGDSATLEAQPTGAGYTYTWYNGSTPIPGVTTATYEAKTAATYKTIVTDNNGCISKLPYTGVVIKVNPLPTPTIAAQGATTIPTNGSVKLVATPGSGVTWQWQLNGSPITGATTKNYIATAGGDYTVVVTKQGCTGTSAITTVIQSSAKEETGTTSATETMEEAFEFAAYPNPVAEQLTVVIRGIEQVDGMIQVMDMNGKLLTSQRMTTSSISLDVSSYATGLYLVRYKDNMGRTGTLKISKQ